MNSQGRCGSSFHGNGAREETRDKGRCVSGPMLSGPLTRGAGPSQVNRGNECARSPLSGTWQMVCLQCPSWRLSLWGGTKPFSPPAGTGRVLGKGQSPSLFRRATPCRALSRTVSCTTTAPSVDFTGPSLLCGRPPGPSASFPGSFSQTQQFTKYLAVTRDLSQSLAACITYLPGLPKLRLLRSSGALGPAGPPTGLHWVHSDR